jgi:putative phage-type endonuclease
MACLQLQPELTWTATYRRLKRLANELMAGELGLLWMRDRCFERTIRLYGIQDQRSVAWLNKRGNMITASEVIKVFSSDASRRELMLKKLEPPATADSNGAGIPALMWGIRFEPIAKQIFEETTHCNVIDVSCATHPVHDFLGASPDGLIVPTNGDVKRYGRLVEFKCPMSREMKPEIPAAYIHQMQMQMECTGIDECEYVEFRFKVVNHNDWSQWSDRKGVFAVFDDGHIEYGNGRSTDECQIVRWILQSIKSDFVPKDPMWLPNGIGALKSFWEEVLKHRAAGTLPEAPAPKAIATMEL